MDRITHEFPPPKGVSSRSVSIDAIELLAVHLATIIRTIGPAATKEMNIVVRRAVNFALNIIRE
jgi:hypothetical protein